MELIVNGSHGIYVPKIFAERYQNLIDNKEEVIDDLQILLKGPDEEYYWDAWDTVLNRVRINNKIIIQSEDLYLVNQNENFYEIL